jgi:hypothetical protein
MTITPEERAKWIGMCNRLLAGLNALDVAEARAEQAEAALNVLAKHLEEINVDCPAEWDECPLEKCEKNGADSGCWWRRRIDCLPNSGRGRRAHDLGRSQRNVYSGVARRN